MNQKAFLDIAQQIHNMHKEKKPLIIITKSGQGIRSSLDRISYYGCGEDFLAVRDSTMRFAVLDYISLDAIEQIFLVDQNQTVQNLVDKGLKVDGAEICPLCRCRRTADTFTLSDM